ncbi:N-acetylmuramoyl-L-alanine amidase [Pseudohoeflea suaedae]|uniref:N-acetylmuramoyl-L-alanine amidase n=1 Tax=Pseudohoeflea suaedae TaxID=877384 RepID=A0A4R5PQJ2_9HYPH|nr:N-acetylmuramoyl-L-alanine amidase [Pseudohoeflea suaedae]TDH39163.1 N-acetylmuramoyl-L-alanine amidase [Pseudohoeflea suaedae]
MTKRGSFGAKALVAAMVLAAGLGIAPSVPAQPFAPAALKQEDGAKPAVAFAARIVADEARARIIVEFESRPDFTIRYLDRPDRIVVDLSPVTFAFDAKSVEARGLVGSLRYGGAGEGRSRLVLGLKGPARLDTAKIEPMESGAGFRLVLDAVATGREAFSELAAGTDWTVVVKGARKAQEGEGDGKPFTVVVDAGHGGIDSGAEGVNGTKEKDVTLAFAQALEEALSNLDDIRVVMTRTSDEFISLSGRLRAAHAADADLFLSLHADSIRIRRLRGATVYTLSDRASDAVAETLAAEANHDEAVVGDVFEQAPESVAGILVDLARNETRVFSTGLAGEIIESFEGEVNLIKNPHRQAGFRVLQSPDLPSALVELGYLSNPEDEKLLTDEAWRESTAGLLAQSIKAYRTTILAAGKR